MIIWPGWCWWSGDNYTNQSSDFLIYRPAVTHTFTATKTESKSNNNTTLLHLNADNFAKRDGMRLLNESRELFLGTGWAEIATDVWARLYDF